MCPEKCRRYFLKSKDTKAILSEASGALHAFVENQIGKEGLEVVEGDFGRVFLIGGKPLLFEREARVFPTLMFEEFLSKLSRVVVDMGAVAHVCSGADVMAPGVVRYEGNFGKGDLVVVVDVRFGKPLLVGEAVVDSVLAKSMSHGEVVKNVHFVGDKLWSFVKASC